MLFTQFIKAIKEGAPIASFLMDDEKVVLTAKDTCIEKKGVRITLTPSFHPEFDAVEWVVNFKNIGFSDSPRLHELLGADILFPVCACTDLRQVGINGDRCSEENFLPFDIDLPVGASRVVKPNGGRSSNGEFPAFDLRCGDSGLICAIGWSGEWQYTLNRTAEGLRLTAGLEVADFFLHPGEEARLPRILLKAFEGDADEGHNSYRRLLFAHYVPKTLEGGKVTLPSALQCFDRYTYQFDYWNTEAGQIDYARRAAKVGNIDTVWLDAAWFKGGFPFGVGNYTIRKGFPNGLRPVSDEVRRLGMKFMLWFEPERVVYGTDIDRAHPEWTLHDPDNPEKGKFWNERKDQDLAQPEVCGLYDLANPEAAKYLTDLLIDFVRREGIDTFRQDFNIDPLRFWRAYDEPGRLGLKEIHYVTNFYALWDALRAAFPGMLIDNCSSGGRRIDLETCMRAVPLWRSDTGCSPITDKTPSDMWNQNQSISLSKYLAYHSIAAWNPTAYEFRSAATNGMASNFDVFSDTFDWKEARQCMAEFARLKKYWLADFYPMTEATMDDTGWSGLQFNCTCCCKGVLYAYRRAHCGQDTHVFALRGLDTSASYRLHWLDEQRNETVTEAKGSDLAAGLTVALDKTRTSMVVEYEKL